MLNRISGWLLFVQVSYLALFAFLALLDVVTRRAIFAAFTRLRSVLHLENTYLSLSDFIYYPMVFSAVLNLALMVVFFWLILRRRYAPSVLSDFFSILNAVYIAASGWILFVAFTNIVRR